MADLRPFRALRPAPEAVARVASVPYDVVNRDEARALASAEPLSFLHVTRSEVDLPDDVSPYDERVYARAVSNLASLTSAAPLVRDDQPALYVYRARMGKHTQTGIAGLFSVDEYDRGLIKKHEKTRKDKEDDRTRHILDTSAQTGVVFLTHPSTPAASQAAATATSAPPLYDFTAADKVQHQVWQARGAEADAFVKAFASMPALYIADGHHRAASAARARNEIRRSGRPMGSADFFIAVSFPADEMQILPYNRIVRDLAGLSTESFLDAVRGRGVGVAAGSAEPSRPGVVAMFVGGRWWQLELPAVPQGTPRADALDVEVLQRELIAPVLNIGDVRTDKRIDFVGGIRGPAELERLVASGAAAVAFAMYPVRIDDLIAIADAGGIMPPKSTWFEPKLRDGILVHVTSNF
jgi:uncharacterized protein (DUF1015 family)